MRSCVIILLTALSISASAQCPIAQKIGSNYQFRAVGGDSATRLSKRFTAPCWLDSGAVMYNPPDSTVYEWTGTQWIPLRGAGSSGGLTQIFGKQHVFITGTDTANFDTLQYRKIYNVVSFGADSTFHSDATPAINAAIAAAVANGGGDIYVPRGRYKIAGALNSSCNCQIVIPAVPSTSNFRPKIRIIGEMSVHYSTGYLSGAGSPPLNTAGSIFISTVTGTGLFPAIVGMAPSTGFAGQNVVDVQFDNIGLEAYTNHATQPITMTGLYFAVSTSWSYYNGFISPDTTDEENLSPMSNEVAGIVAGSKGNGGPIQISRLTISGFKYGLVTVEHTTLVDPQIWACGYGIVFPHMDFDTRGFALIHACAHQMYWPTVPVMGIPAGTSPIEISLESEIDSIAGLTGSFWYKSLNNIVDSGQNAQGYLKIDNKEGGTSRNLNSSIGLATAWSGNNLNIWPLTKFGPGNMVFQTADTTSGAINLNIRFNPQSALFNYLNTGPGMQFDQFGGNQFFRGFPSGAGGGAVSPASRIMQLWLDASGRVGINNESPDPSARLDVVSTNSGFLPPRMTTTQKLAIVSAKAGLIVYDTTLNQMSYFNGTTWVNF
jgi:Pectate lyase superfamily protein